MTTLPIIKIKGLLWQAEAQAIRLEGPLTEPNDDNWTLRNLWVEKRKDNSRYAPGTLIVLCWIKSIKIEPISGKIYKWERASSEKPPEKPNLTEIESQLKSGNFTLLLLQADSQSPDWKPNQIPECTCIAGDIYLIDALQPQNNSRDRLYNALGVSIKKDSANKLINPTTRPNRSQLLAPIAVHSSGLTIFGEVKLPWLETMLTAPFQLSPLIENGSPISKFRLRLEEERLIPVNEQGVISEEVNAWIKAWQILSQFVDPLSKLSEVSENDLKKYSNWVTLQVNNPNIVPPLYWQIDAWPKSDDTLQSYPVSFTQNAFRLVLTDQSLYNSDIVPNSLAQVAPLVTIQPEQNPLNIKIVATKQDQETKEIANEKLFYTGKQILDPDNQNNKKWQESINLSNLITTFSPTQVSQILREYQDIPIPEWFPLLENDPSEVGSVAAWQNILYGCGYLSELRITGEMDLETVKLTKKFQKDLGLNQTDKVTPETWQAGLDILKNDPSEVGSVAAWQNILYRCGYTLEIRITGVMDLETIDLTKKFQQDLGLNQTGKVTLETWQAGLKHKKIFNWFHWISSKKTIEPALIWGFMPLEDGWAQLPFINLTEQIYVDANITSLNGSNFQATAQKVLPLLQGAVSFGNDRELVRKQEQVMGENAWSVTLVDGTNLVGKWKLQQKQNKEYELTDIELTIEKPDVNIQGLLWLSTGKPRSQDALPDFSNWVSGLRSIPLRTLQLERETFPPLIELLIKTLSFTPRNSSEEKNNQLIPVASLGQWQFRYQLRQEIFKQMTNKGILSTNTFSQFLPMIWRRHPHLPMIQALPMTQNQSPPNYPAASRQLVPYELPVNSEGIPNVWDFGITEEKGALNWAKYLKPEMLKPAQEWVQQLDLSLVSLSLPGLVLSPHNQFPHVKLELKTQLYLQYRFDLPYTDEINALAQLPKVLPKPDEISPLPNSLQPQPAKALTRETFKDYWQQLAERASLASGDAIFGLAKREDKTLLENLIEPLVWEVNATFNLDTYPGRLELSNADNQAKLLSLEGNKALEGISGKFIELNGNIKLNGGSNNSYNITAGSMAARLENDQIRDQRGLSRGVSKVDVDEKKSGKLLITTVLFQSQIQGQIQSQFYNLTTTLEALPLQIDEKETWRLWFRDVPFQDTVFDRLTTLSPQAEDINDPEAQSLDFNYRSGYEWRLNGSTTSRLPLKLFGLDFYPLRLAKMTIIDQQIDTIEIIGRLQLPLQGIGEIETLSNAVNLKLKWKQELKKYVPNSLSLASFPSPVSLVDSLGEWILNADKNSNTNLRLEWKSIKLNGDKTAIELSQLTLQFYLFNTNWIVPLSGKSLSFPNTTVVEHIIPETDDFSLTGIVVDFSQLSSPNVSLDFSVKFGDRFGEIPPQNRRITNGLQVLYTFTEGTGDTVLDRTQTPNPLNLKIKNTDSGTIDWLSGGGLRIKKSNIIKSITKATKLITACKKTNEISIEVWIKPQQEIQKAGRIVTLSEDRNNRNFTLAQGIFEFQSKEYNVRLRHTEAGVPNDGLPALQTRNDGLPALQTRSDAIITDQPSHLIYTRKKDEVKIYLNGQELSPQKSIASKGDFSNWDESYFFALGNEMTEDRAWLGEYYLIAVYNRALTLEEVQQNFSVGHLFPEILDNSEKAIAFQGIFQYNLIKQSITSFNGRLLDDLNIVISQEDNLNNILVNQSLQIHWQKCTAEKIPYLLPGILLDPSQISGYAALTFTIESKNNAMPLLKINSATVEALMVTHWGEFLQEQKPASNQAIFGSSAGDLAIGYLGELTTPEKFDDLEKTWQESLLFNGVVELKNLISWPQEITINNTGITLPSASVNPTINLLSHYRHSLKILFNQHQILPEQLTVGPGQNLLFTLSKDKSWQFLAVVEHQLIIVNPNEDLTQIRSTDEHRWTAVQNISITTPEQFGTFLKNLDQVSIENPALATTTSPFQINFGYLRSDLRTSLVKEFNKLSSHILLVEATTPFWLRKTPLKDLPQPISLQILPNGTQQAILSRPQDYYPTAPTDPQWLLLIMPFLGRLQPSSEDQLESQSMTKTHLDTLNALQVDPILLLHYWRKLSPSQAIPALKLALALSHWTDLGELQINLSGFDLMLNRLWSRLDPLALEESWFRLQNPPPEAKPTFLQSILSAFPDTSARLSRDTALKRLFSFVRTFYPPQVSSNLSLDDMALIQQSEEAFLLLLQGVIDKPQANSIPYGWLLSGILLVQAFKGGAASSLNRHPVATLLSTRFKGGNNQANPFPQSLTVSPYLGLQLQSLAETPVTELRLVVAELLCLNPSSQVLRPVASYTWESQKFSTNLDFQDILNNPAANLLKLREKFRRNNIILSEKDVNIQVSGLANGEWEIVDQETQFTCRVRVREQDKQLIFYQDRLTIGELAKSWALQTQERLYPESPFAILRFREIDQVISEKPTTIIPLVVRYAFELVEIEPSPLVVQRTFRLRSPLRQLRFREAQFNPGLIPNLETIKPFEVAPPQTAGVQPIYLLPPESNSQVDWGLSALRVSIHYSEGQQAIADSLLNGSEHQHTLWWQGCQHTVQFRSAKTAGNTNAVAGLPPLFRAPAIKGFLPAVSDLPLPDIKLNHQEKLQSILPGSLSYLLLGNRPGVMFALRHQLLRQPLGQSSEVLVSGSIPVQHRMPRPVPLPDNQGQEVAGTEARTKERALQTWASYFEPQKRLIAETSPIDEAFYAQCGDHPARRLQVKLISPKYGAILADWDGLLAFEFKMNPNEAGLSNWQIKKVNLIDGLQSIEYQIPEVLTSVLSCNFIPNDKNKSILKRILSEKLGYSVTVRVSIEPNPEDKHFQQILSFPLILAGQFARPLALEPYFIHFEDPEYNRRLASASAHSSRTIKLKKASEMNVQLITLTLSADRREYNTDSLLSFRFDWNLTQEELVVLKETEETLQKKTTATLKFTRISNDQEIEFEYAQESGQVLNRAGHLQSFFLNQFIEKNNANRVGLQAGDKLKISVTKIEITEYNVQEDLDKNPIVLIVNIVATPVNPVPQAAYALLRTYKFASNTPLTEVECVRFAWSPEPERIELVCAEDLRQEVVRRRAVFHWQDSTRISEVKPIYEIQKITETGSTHFPGFE